VTGLPDHSPGKGLHLFTTPAHSLGEIARLFRNLVSFYAGYVSSFLKMPNQIRITSPKSAVFPRLPVQFRLQKVPSLALRLFLLYD
jgi:hypothetical protein